jgi:hypothetical protein
MKTPANKEEDHDNPEPADEEDIPVSCEVQYRRSNKNLNVRN